MTLGRLGRMAYINTLPVDWGLVHGGLAKWVSLRRGTPRTLNSLLAAGVLDLSPVSLVAAAEHAEEWLVLDRLCIGSRGEVGSVILHSPRPVWELDRESISVTSASATAVKLLDLLLTRHWEIDARLVTREAETGPRLLIGDIALKTAQCGRDGFIYDLGRTWKEFSGRDFVFGVWCMRRAFAEANPDLATALHELILASHAMGRQCFFEVVQEAARTTGLTESAVRKYFGKLVHTLDDSLMDGLRHFLHLIGHDPDRLRIFAGGADERKDMAAKTDSGSCGSEDADSPAGPWGHHGPHSGAGLRP